MFVCFYVVNSDASLVQLGCSSNLRTLFDHVYDKYSDLPERDDWINLGEYWFYNIEGRVYYIMKLTEPIGHTYNKVYPKGM